MTNLRNRVFPDHWSLWLGQIAVHCFVIVLISGLYLVFYYEPSIKTVAYDGPYEPLRGVPMSRALASTLDLSFKVRCGLLMRQVHHWASLLMIVALLLHMLRIFFTGAFRKPRTTGWLVLFSILSAAMAAGFTGAVLPDDMLSGTSLTIMDGVMKSIPLVGVDLSSLVFGGPFPGNAIATRRHADDSRRPAGPRPSCPRRTVATQG